MNKSDIQIAPHKIIVLDFGSQYTQLIARRIRESRVYSEIHPCTITLEDLRALEPDGIILSGAPASVYDDDAPMISPDVFELGVPVLGICYGMQLTSHLLRGKVAAHAKREYGRADLIIDKTEDLFEGFTPDESIPVWMSHGDRVEKLPTGFEIIAHSPNAHCAAIRLANAAFSESSFTLKLCIRRRAPVFLKTLSSPSARASPLGPCALLSICPSNKSAQPSATKK